MTLSAVAIARSVAPASPRAHTKQVLCGACGQITGVLGSAAEPPPDYCRQGLVLDIDALGCVLRGMQGLGDDERHRLAHVSDHRVGEQGPWRRDHRCAVHLLGGELATDGAEPRRLDVRAGVDAEHLGHRGRRGSVDACDARMGMHRAQHVAGGLAFETDVVGEPSVPGEEAAVFLAKNGIADAGSFHATSILAGRRCEAGAMRDYMERLRANGELLVTDRPVAAKHELAAVTERVQRTVNRPILFNRVSDSELPVLTNLYGSRKRLADILGIAPDEFCRKWNELTTLGTFTGPLKVDVPLPNDLTDAKVSDLPLITYSERDGGPYFTSALFVAKEPETGVPNLSFHRSMYISDEELRCRLAPRHHLTLYHEKAERMGQHLEAAMLIGPPPEVFLAAASPVPYDVDELEVAASLAGKPLEMRPCKHIDLTVPASTEVVIEGRFLPNERRPEGPFGEFMGYYVPVGDNAVFEVLGVTMRPDAVFHSINCGSSEEVLTLELSVAANIYSRINAVLPGILDVTCVPFVTHTVVKIRQQYEGHGRQVLLAVFGADLTWPKMCTVVDEDVDIYDLNEVIWAVLTRSRPDRDVIIIPDTPSFYRDPYHDHWARLGIDATAPFERRDKFERKKVPGVGDVDLSEYFDRLA